VIDWNYTALRERERETSNGYQILLAVMFQLGGQAGCQLAGSKCLAALLSLAPKDTQPAVSEHTAAAYDELCAAKGPNTADFAFNCEG
jgi:hypothetical protein